MTTERLRRAVSAAVAVLAALACAAPATASAGLLSAADGRSFASLSRSLGGRSGLAVSPVGRGQPVEALGTLRTGVAWSTSKVPVAMAAVAAGTGAQADLENAITASDNAAAERLWASLGAGAGAAADAQLRAAGDARTVTEAQRLRPGYTAFGQTAWRLSDQARFAAGMGCVPAAAPVLALMGRIVAPERWGLGAAGVPAQFKGGWGPGVLPGRPGGWLERQFGILTVRGQALAVAIATVPADASHASGTRALTRIARWLVAHVGTARATQPAC